MNSFGEKISFIWSVADLLRGPYRPNQYKDVMLPMTVLRRLDCVMEPTRDKVRARLEALAGGKVKDVESSVCRKLGVPFFNTSRYTFEKLKGEPDNIAANLTSYIKGFSSRAREIIEHFGFEEHIAKLDKADRLFLLVSKFCEIDLHPDRVSNIEMGYIFEELIRRFNEASNEEAGDHFTPREVIRLMVNLLFLPDGAILTTKGIIKTLCDPACGTGGMLSVAEKYVRELNPDAHLTVFGQDYNWIVTNRKARQRRGKVSLVNAASFSKNSLGNKRQEICDPQRDEITRLYGEFREGEHVRILDNAAFGYRRITVERPLRLNFAATPERLAALEAEPAFQALAASKKRKDRKAAEAEIAAGREQQQAILHALEPLGAEGVVRNREAFADKVKAAFEGAEVKVPAALLGRVLMALAERDETADVGRDAKGNVEPDPALRDYENVPLQEDVGAYMRREVLPHVPDARVDDSKTKVGYEIGLNRYFYTYTAPRPLEEIEGELKQIEREIADMLAEVTELSGKRRRRQSTPAERLRRGQAAQARRASRRFDWPTAGCVA